MAVVEAVVGAVVGMVVAIVVAIVVGSGVGCVVGIVVGMVVGSGVGTGVGGAVTVITLLFVAAPLTVRTTVYVPGVWYVYEVLPEEPPFTTTTIPSPKSHFHEVPPVL